MVQAAEALSDGPRQESIIFMVFDFLSSKNMNSVNILAPTFEVSIKHQFGKKKKKKWLNPSGESEMVASPVAFYMEGTHRLCMYSLMFFDYIEWNQANYFTQMTLFLFF